MKNLEILDLSENNISGRFLKISILPVPRPAREEEAQAGGEGGSDVQSCTVLVTMTR